MEAGPSQVPVAHSLFGTVPGVLDPTQPSRILRFPSSTLSFASFDPLTASNNQESQRKSNGDDSYRPKRIVIETVLGPDGFSTWRFVPRARREQGVEDEGAWPRVIEICGVLALCSLEQWEIYKLDPAYQCFVHASPKLTTITTIGVDASATNVHGNAFPVHDELHATPPPRHKRQAPSPTSSNKKSAEDQRKKFRTTIEIASSSSSEDGRDAEHPINLANSDLDEDEVEEIVVDFTPPKRKEGFNGYGRTNFFKPDPLGAAREREKRFRKMEERRKQRREQLASRTRSTFKTEPSSHDTHVPKTEFTNQGFRYTEEFFQEPVGARKRKAPTFVFTAPTSPYFPASTESEFPSGAGKPYKRSRTRSPTSSQQEFYEKMYSRKKNLDAKFKGRWQNFNDARHSNIMQDIMADVPEDVEMPTPQPQDDEQSSSSATEQNEPQVPQETEEEAQRRAAIEESRRKLAELEMDRPLWEAEARKRQARERAEEAERLAKKQEQRRKAEWAEAQARKRHEAEQAEAERKARIERDRVRWEQQQAQKRKEAQRQRWSYGPWTPQRALERYRMLCESFDAAKFGHDTPATFDSIPWPVLHSPITLSVENIDWAAVESFFKSARTLMRTQDYKTFVIESHKRFHPDRWRARGVLKSVEEDELRGCLEVAANTVAQAITPLWREIKG